MTDRLAIAIAQLNPTVGDIAGNLAKLRRARAEAAGQGADLVVGSELFVAGYPPEDLVLKPAFRRAHARRRCTIWRARPQMAGRRCIVGTPWRQDGKLYNAAALLDGGQVAALRFKHDLPNYGVFDEKRVFAAGPAPGPDRFPRRAARRDGLRGHVDARCRRVAAGKRRRTAARRQRLALRRRQARRARRRWRVARVEESGLPLLYVNQVGGQDELVFDGASFAVDAECDLRAPAAGLARGGGARRRWTRGADDRWTVEAGLLEPAARRASKRSIRRWCWACATM